jgi:hypothetical protein
MFANQISLEVFGSKQIKWTKQNIQIRTINLISFNLRTFEGPSWSWSYSSWIYYLCNQCLSPLMLWDRIYIRARRTTLCDKVCQCFATCRWFSPDLPVSTTHKTEYNWNIVESGVKQQQTNEYLRYIIYFWEMIQILHEYKSNISIKHSMYKYD